MDESIARKLAVPKKLTAWEREKQAAEAKRREQDAEAAAALKDFQKSLGVDSDEDLPPARRDDFDSGRPPQRTRGPRFSGAHDKSRSGPGSLGPIDRHEPQNHKRKRALDEARDDSRRRDGFDRREEEAYSRNSRRQPSLEPEYEAPKPTVYLQSLPPNITVEDLKAVLAPHLKVYSIRLLERQALTAVATLTSDTNLTQIDDAVRNLKDKYLGCGHRLSISRYDEAAFNSKKSVEPFNATLVERPRASLRNAPPPDERDFGRRFNDRGPRQRQTEVKVSLPLNISTVHAIHTLADRLLAEPDEDHAMEMEALIMQVPEVQLDERFSFLYDSSSPAGVYYRYCLWGRSVEQREPERIHDDSNIDWNISTQGTTFPNLTHLANVVTDMDYASSEEESDDEDDRQRPADRPDPDNLLAENERNFMLPLQHARLTHLLSRLPTSNTRLRTGDVARVTNFAIRHAGNGAEQIVDKLLLNVDLPFSLTTAAKYEDISSDSDELPPDPEGEPQSRTAQAVNARLVALYVISDLLSASATAGARNSWKYRQLFEASFLRAKTFEKLGQVDSELGWGRLKMDQWKRKIGVVLDLWENWSVFSVETLQALRRSLHGEPEPEPVQTEQKMDESEVRKPRWMTAIKPVEKAEKPEHLVSIAAVSTEAEPAPVDERPEDSTMVDAPQDRQAEQQLQPARLPDQETRPAEPSEPVKLHAAPKEQSDTSTTAPKRRMRAEDMFADSDDEKKL